VLGHESVKIWHVMLVLGLFWAMWLWTEFTEDTQRTQFQESVHAFMNRGDRFTAQDGKVLRERIEKLEKELETDK
jgi:hypothetical protein